MIPGRPVQAPIMIPLGILDGIIENLTTPIFVFTSYKPSRIPDTGRVILFCIDFGRVAIYISTGLLVETDKDVSVFGGVATLFTNPNSVALVVLSCRFSIILSASESINNSYNRSDIRIYSEEV